MRLLTLNERITIRGLLAKRGVEISPAIKSSSEFINFWNMAYGKSILFFAKYL